MKKSGSKFAVISIIVTTVLSTLIGGYATLAARSADLAQIDQSLQKVVTRVNAFPSEAISAAILTIEGVTTVKPHLREKEFGKDEK